MKIKNIIQIAYERSIAFETRCTSNHIFVQIETKSMLYVKALHECVTYNILTRAL